MLNSLVQLKHSRTNVYIVCEEMDFTWDERDAVAFDSMWNEGMCIDDISKAFDRDIDEVALLVIDRARKGYITKRVNGLQGRRMPTHATEIKTHFEPEAIDPTSRGESR